MPLVEAWDPLAGYAPNDEGLSPTPTAGLLALLLARDFVTPEVIAEWLWSHHPSWAGVLPKDAKDKGASWVRGYLLGVAYPLGLVEVSGEFVRLSAARSAPASRRTGTAHASCLPANAARAAERRGAGLPAGLNSFAHCRVVAVRGLEGHWAGLHARTDTGADLPRPRKRPDAADDRADAQPTRHAARPARGRGPASALGKQTRTHHHLFVRGVGRIPNPGRTGIGGIARGGHTAPHRPHRDDRRRRRAVAFAPAAHWQSRLRVEAAALPHRGRRRRDAHRGHPASRFAARSRNRAVRGGIADRPKRHAALPADASVAPAMEVGRPLSEVDQWFVDRTGARSRPPGGFCCSVRRCRPRKPCVCWW